MRCIGNPEVHVLEPHTPTMTLTSFPSHLRECVRVCEADDEKGAKSVQATGECRNGIQKAMGREISISIRSSIKGRVACRIRHMNNGDRNVERSTDPMTWERGTREKGGSRRVNEALRDDGSPSNMIDQGQIKIKQNTRNVMLT